MGKTGRIVLLTFVIVIISIACSFTPVVNTRSAELTQTAVYETAVEVVKQTQAAATPGEAAPSPTMAATLEPTPVPPTATSSPTALPTATDIPTAIPTAIPTVSIPCNKASFVKDVTVPDGTEMKPGESFVKTWRITNSGSCTWTPAYQLVFSSGERMSAPGSVNLSGNVSPSSTVDISVQLVSPASDGSYTAYFMLKAPDGTIFGMGNSNTSLSAVIKVKKSAALPFPIFTAIIPPSLPTKTPLPPLPEKACDVHYNWVDNMWVDGRFDAIVNLVNKGSRTWGSDFVLAPVVGEEYFEGYFYSIPHATGPGKEFFFEAPGYDPDKGKYPLRSFGN